jgi:hypothetical protein
VADTINLLLGAFMGICCMIAFALIHASPSASATTPTSAPAITSPSASATKGDAAFALFWGVWWWVILIVYALFHSARVPDWFIQCVDMVGNASLFVAAYALYRGATFEYVSPTVVQAVVAAAILIVLSALGGLLGPPRSVDWQVFATAPSQILATAAFIALGIAGGTRFPAFRVSIYVLCGIYAILQVPAYHAVFIEPVEHSSGTAEFWKWWLAAGKVAFAINAAGMLGFLRTSYMKWGSVLLTFLSTIFGFAIAIIRFMTATGS